MTKPTLIKCQFCPYKGRIKTWLNKGNTCPACGRDYDYLLAQEMDDS